MILTEIQQPVMKRLLKYNMGPIKTHALTNAFCSARLKTVIEYHRGSSQNSGGSQLVADLESAVAARISRS